MIRRSGGIYRSASLLASSEAAFDIKKPPAKIGKTAFINRKRKNRFS
ncbi:MAG: hypothetical protein WC619_04545 [Patescibacteria group bacterium]